MSMSLTKTQKLGILAGLVAADTGLLDDAKVHLFKNDIQPNENTLLAGFTAADYSGYAAKTVVSWGGPFIGVDGKAKVVAASLQFQPNAATVGNICYGYYVTDAAGTTLLGHKRFDQPVTLDGTASAVIVQVELPYGN